MKKLLTYIAMGSATTSYAVTLLWMRDVQISLDGTEMAPCYKGDIYKVPVRRGTATQLTTRTSYECTSIWSPDRKQIAFTSDRNGSFDLFIMPSNGGTAQCLTTCSAFEIPSAFTSGGGYVLFSTSIQDPAQSVLLLASIMTELYKVPAGGGRTEQALGAPTEVVCSGKFEKAFLYQDRKGFEDEWHKHHTSSVTRDIWMYDTRAGKHTNLVGHAGEDRNAVFTLDGQTVYFLSERNGGSFNVHPFLLNIPQSTTAVTKLKTHPIRLLFTDNDQTLCCTYDDKIYTQRPRGNPQRVRIDLVRNDQEQTADLNSSKGATSATVSPDGKQIALILKGEVFIISADYNMTKQITHTLVAETGICFSPNNRILAYTSERGGNQQPYLVKITRKEEANFPNTTITEEKVLLPSGTVERNCPQFSSDGKEFAFIEDHMRLMIVSLETKKVCQVTDGSIQYSIAGSFDYSWSSNGKWFTLRFIGSKRDPYSDTGLVSAQGGEITNPTNSGYISTSPQQVLDGNAILFTTGYYGICAYASWGFLNDIILVFMDRDVYDKFRSSKEDYELQRELEEEQKEVTGDEADDKKKEDKADGKKDEEPKDIVVELKGIQDRILRPTPNFSKMGSTVILKNSETLYCFSALEDKYDPWKVDLCKKETKLPHKMNTGWANMEIDKESKNLFLLSSNPMQKMNMESEKLTSINYRASSEVDLTAECEYMFGHVYKQEQKQFYNVNMHGVNWEAMTAIYRKFLLHTNNSHDFAELLSEYLEGLNVSHTGRRFRPRTSGSVTANLGLLFDWGHSDKGLLIVEVVEKGPFDHTRPKMKAGTIMGKIDGQEVTPDMDCSKLLNNKAKKETLVSLYDPQTKERWKEIVLPTSNGELNNLLYTHQVKQRVADTDKWSDGRLGYVHTQPMRGPSFRSVHSDILGKYNNREGVVIDTRPNGGGRLHEDIEVSPSGEKCLTQVIHGREACDMPSRRWNKLSIMLQHEANYSSAHGTPWVYKYQQVGCLVDIPAPRTVTTVSWEALQDLTLISDTPIIGYRLLSDSHLGNIRLEPNIKVANSPGTAIRGEDTQLRTAVQELLKEINKK